MENPAQQQDVVGRTVEKHSLKPLELASGIGWLAREDKIFIYPIMGLSILKSIKNVTFDCEAWLEKHCTHVM